MKKIWYLVALVLCLCLVSCGNVADTDGVIGNESAEKMQEGMMDLINRSEKMADDVKDGVEDIKDNVKDAVDDMVSAEIDTDAGARLTTEQAKLTALSDAGVAAKDVTFYKTYLHNEDGREFYDVEFSYGGTEYDYEIDAYTGAVLAKELESDR